MRKAIENFLVRVGVIERRPEIVDEKIRYTNKCTTRNYPKFRNKKRFNHRGCWAVVCDEVLYFKSQAACASYIADVYNKPVKQYDVYNALSKGTNRLMWGRKLFAKVYYDKPQNR